MPKRSRQQGELENLILDALWDANGALTSQQILDAVSPKRELALTTILTVLSRLIDKSMVSKEAGSGRSLLFRATSTREKFAAESMLKLFSTSGNPALALSHFASGLTQEQIEALRRALD